MKSKSFNQPLHFRRFAGKAATSGLLCLMLLSSAQTIYAGESEVANQQVTQQQGQTVTGTVTDAKGEPLVGVNVSVKGTTKGTITDLNGKYTLQVPGPNATLVFSYVGYLGKTQVVGNTRIVSVKLAEDTKVMDEVVVVGYGTQKKATLTGAVTQVKGDDIMKGRASSNAGTALQGAIPGLTITRTSSRPTENATFSLRGGISINGDVPLVLIDGVNADISEFNALNPSDIESVSVLKDASASIYGARAAGGVMLVTTKRAKSDKTQVSYNGSATMNYQGKPYPAATGSQWAQMMLSADYEDTNHPYGGSTLWTILGFNTDAYKRVVANEAFDWVNSGKTYRIDPLNAYQPDYVYGTTWGQKHNLSIQGGTKNIKSLTTLGFADDRSLIKVTYDGQKKYNFRNNTDYVINDYIKAQTDLSYDNRVVDVPTYGIGYGLQDFYVFPLYTQSGQSFYDNFGGNNVVGHLVQGGRSKTYNYLLRMSGKVNVDLSFISPALKGLSASAKGSIRQFIKNKKVQGHRLAFYNYNDILTDGTVSPTLSGIYGAKASLEDFTEANEKGLYQLYEYFLNYDRSFGKHHISGMFGNTNELQDFYGSSIYRSNSTPISLFDINLYDATTTVANKATDQAGVSNPYGASKFAFVSVVGRANYDYAGKYLFQGTWRHDGCSKLVANQRWDNFFSFDAGWRVSEEAFLKNSEWLSNLKLRGTWGQSGNIPSNISNYEAYALISNSTTVLGTTPGKVTTGWISGITDDTRTWERVNSTNVGVDFGVFKNKLSGTFDYFWRKNDGMLINITYPSTYGGTAPKTNSGTFKTNGWEASLNWQDKIGKDFGYNVGVTLADARTNVDSYAGKSTYTHGVNSVVQGYPLNSLFVYKTDGMFQTQEEVNAYYTKMNGNVSGSQLASLKQNTVNELTPGSVRKVDLNGDNDITVADLTYYGDIAPHYTYGVNLGASYKGLDFSCFIQGVAQQYGVRSGQMGAAFWSGWTNTNGNFLGNTWTSAGNPYYGGNSNAKYPVMSRNGNRNNWNYKYYNDVNVVNMWYARFKQLSLGYTLPKSLTQKVNLSKVRAWISGENLFDISNVKDGYDPEAGTTMSTYSGVDIFASSFSFGLDITF